MNERVVLDKSAQRPADVPKVFDAWDIMLSNQMVSEGCPNVGGDLKRETGIIPQTVANKEAI